MSDDHIETNGMGILSYSYKDLVAIHSYSSGSFTSENDYIEGCPSFKATNVQFDVQGTSSQGQRP